MSDDVSLPAEGDPVAAPSSLDAAAFDAAATASAPGAPGAPGAAVDGPDSAAAPRDRGDLALLGLIDRLAAMLERSDLSELEVGSGGTDIVLRKPSAIAAPIVVGAGSPAAGPGGQVERASATGGDGAGSRGAEAPSRPSVKAPLTGIFYASPAPGSAPYVQAGGEVAVGQVIGLIEAMKLFNEIKSDLAGRVVRVIPESGTLVKAKQPLLEVDPL
jgi:acetyl-CoA carboxylase biotin carboxyl carrier protein